MTQMILGPPKEQKSQKIYKQAVRRISIHLKHLLMYFEGGILPVTQHKCGR